MNEVWKDIDGYKDSYQVSNKGNIRSLDRKVKNGKGFITLKGRMRSLATGKGYRIITLTKNGKGKTYRVHQLVAIAFLNHKPCGFKVVVDHIDNNSLNNNLSNLQLISNRKNLSKDRKGGTSKYTGVSWKKSRKVWLAKILIDGKVEHLGGFKSEALAGKEYKRALKEYEARGLISRPHVKKASSSKKGVHWDNERSKWVAQIWIGGKNKSLGRFSKEMDASKAYKSAVEKYKIKDECI